MRKTFLREMIDLCCRRCSVWMVLLFFLSYTISLAQRPRYHIVCSLDPVSHTLAGTMDITYINRSSIELDSLGIHLWPNAYANKQSAYAQQLKYHQDYSFNSAPFTSMGWISGMSFNSPGHEVQLGLDDQFKDIGWLMLSPALRPGDSIRLSSPFQLQVPKSFSRLGYTGTSYQFTQWYPHLAVLDQEGWHVMPYLDQGEFFNDFADYDVELEVPAGYKVAATGVLISKEDKGSVSVLKYSAQNVIDFAWFASPTFQIKTDTIIWPDGKTTLLQIYKEPVDTEHWDEATTYAGRALQFYSEWLGAYPYPQMSVVSAPWSKGGYMEYPMVAQLSYTGGRIFLDLVTAHEIGHTWLYGILANNERVYPWLDEGLNTFIEDQYRQQYHPGYTDYYFPGIMHSGKAMPDTDAHQYNYRFEGKLQPPATPPERQADDQYYFSAYRLPSQGLELMKEKLGVDMMKKMFRQYFAEHQFTHVTPEDMQQSFQEACECDLNWFFKDWIEHAHELDYRLAGFDRRKKEVVIANKGNALIPVKLTSFQDGEKIADHWMDGFEGKKTLRLDERADEVRIYDGMMGINGHYTKNIKPRTIIPRIRFLPQVESYSAPTLGVTPIFGYNLADGFMPGIALTSGWFPQNKFKWIAAPMYGLESKELRGFATLRYTSELNRGPFDRLVLSFGLDDFGYNLDTHYLFRDEYFKWEPTLALRTSSSAKHPQLASWWKYRFVHIRQEYGRGINFESGIYEEESRSYGVHELMYEMRSENALRPFEGIANLQAGKGFLRLNLQYKQHFVGKNKHRGTWIRGFAGWLPVYDQPDANVAFTFNGIASNGYFSKDYMFDQWLGGRNAESGIFAHQSFERDANLKTLTTVGIGEEWMIAAGVSQAFPFRFLHFYMDATLFSSAVESKTQFSYSGGAAIVLWKDVFEIYLPLLESKDILQSASYDVRDIWFERVSFRANFKFLNPVNRLDRDQLMY